MSPIQSPLWGITPTQSEAIAKGIDFIEVSYFDLVQGMKPPPLGQKLSVSASIWHLVSQDWAEAEERFEILNEVCTHWSAAACVLRLTLPFLAQPESEEQVFEFYKRWQRQLACPLYFECGRDGPPAWLDPSYCVSDPLWFQGQAWSSYWKIHGWHEERWVRQYAQSELVHLATLAKEYRPRYVVLAHSQRSQQISNLKQAWYELIK
jgi:hypothetical protein